MILDNIKQLITEAKKEKEPIVKEIGLDYVEETIDATLVGKGPMIKLVYDAIQKTPFKYKNKYGETVEGGYACIKGKYKVLDEDKFTLKLKLPTGSISSAVTAINKSLSPLKFKLKKG